MKSMSTNKNEFYVVSVEDTIKYGIVSAAIIGRVKWWCEYNEKNKKQNNFHIDYWWSGFMSSKEFSQQLGISSKTIEKHLSKLLKDGVLIKGVFNKKGFDRTGWYRVNPHPPIEETISPNRVDDLPNQSKSISPNRVNGNTPIEETIPVSISINQNVKQSASITVNPPVELEEQIIELTKLILDNSTIPDDRYSAMQKRDELEKKLETLKIK
jgi:biotin operon repressor